MTAKLRSERCRWRARRAIITAPTALAIMACNEAPEWADRAVQPVPAYFSNRNVLPDESGIYRYKLTELPGRLLFKDASDTNYSLMGLVLKSGYRPTLAVIPEEEGKVYEGIINRQTAIDVSYLGLGGAIDDNSLADVQIKDRLLSFIASDDVPWSLLAAEGRRQKPTPTTKRFWIQGVLLATLDYRRATEVDLKAGGKLTEAFGANGKIYNKAESSVHDYRVSVLLVDIDALLDPVLRLRVGEPPTELFTRGINRSRPNKLILRIKNPMNRFP